MKSKQIGKLAAAAALAAFAAACASSQARKVGPSTFLGSDVQLLQKGEKGQALMRYEAPGVDWASYKSVLIDPVEYWMDPDSKDKLSDEDKKKLTDYFYNELRQDLGKRLTVAQQPGPNTLRLKYAVVQAEKNKPVRDTLSSTIPQPFILSSLKKGVTGKPTGVGEVQGEMKASDSMSGQTLLAAVDKRYGRKKFGGKFNRWDDVESALRYWSSQTSTRLCELQGGADCGQPTEKKEEGSGSGSK